MLGNVVKYQVGRGIGTIPIEDANFTHPEQQHVVLIGSDHPDAST